MRLIEIKKMENRQMLVCCAYLLSKFAFGDEGSIPSFSAKDTVAQLAEQEAVNFQVVGSNPSGIANAPLVKRLRRLTFYQQSGVRFHYGVQNWKC